MTDACAAALLYCVFRWRLAAAVVIFFMTSFVRHQIRSSVPEIDPKLAYQVRSENVLVKRKRHHDLLPTMPPQFLTDLRVLFDRWGQLPVLPAPDFRG